MAQNIKVLVNTGNEQTNKAFDVASGSGKAGKPTTIKAIKGARYQFEDLAAKNVGPENIRSKRVGKNLHVMLEGGQEADLIIENFYDDAMLTDSNRGLYGRAEDGKLYEYIPEDPRLEGMPINLADGAKPVSQVLGGGQVGDGFALSGVILAAGAGSVAGAGGLGFSALTVGAAAVGAAALGGGGGGGATTAPSPAQTALAKIEAYNNSDGTNPAALTLQDYADAGITGVTVDNLPAVNAQVLKQNALGADTSPEVQALVAAANTALAKIEAYNNGNGTTSAALTVQDFVDAGITGVTSGNLAAVNANILAQSTGAANTSPEVQALADTAAAMVAALETIAAAALADNATSGNLAASVFATAGVTGVDSTNLSAIQSALDSAAVNGLAADTTVEVQTIVDAFNAIKANADSAATANATQAQYAAIGVNGIDNAAKTSLLGDVVDAKAFADVDTVGELQTLATAAAAVITGAASGTAPTKAQLEALGITGVTDANLFAVQAAIAATADDGTGVDTLSELQTVVNTGAANAAAAVSAIAAAAQANDATNTNVAASVFATAGVTGVDSTNIAAIQSALNDTAVQSAQADTAAKVQTIVDAYNAILAEANDTANTAGNGTADANPASNPTAAQYAAIGVNLGAAPTDAATDTETLALLNAIVGGKQTADVDTVAEVQELARIANAIQLTAAGGTPNPALAVADLTKLGLDTTGVNSSNLPTLLAAMAAKSDTGSETDTLAKLQTLVDNLDKVAPTTPASAPASYADNVGTITSTTSTAARTDDDSPGVLVGTGLSDTVSLYVDGVKVAATYDSATGRITPNVALSEGAKSITYTLTDASGNESGQSPAISITVDKTAAVVVADNRTLSEDFVTATGNVSTNDTSKDGTEVYALVGANGSGDVSGTYAGLHMNSNGTYTLSPNSANIHAIAQNTDQAFSYTVTDAAGNTTSSTITFTFTPVNDAPTGTNTTIAVLEDGIKPFAGADFGFNDVDANTLSAVIITTLPTAGTLKLNGTNVTLNQSIAVADLGNLVFAPAANVNGNAYTTIGFKVQDNGGTANGGVDTSATANTLTINITPVDDAPVLNNTSVLAYTENDAEKPINTLVTVSDLDNISLASATVSITTGYVAGQDVLSFTNVSMGNIAGNYASGVMTLTSAGSTATLAEWQAALRAVAYSNTSDAPSTAARTVSYVINDGQLDSTPVTSTVNLTAVNDAPVINQGTTVNLNSVLQDAQAPVNGNTTAGTLVGTLLDAITDPDGNVPKGILVTGAGAGYESLYYSTDGGSTWINLTNLTVNNAVFLDANSRIFYKPVAGTTGFKTGAVWYRAWDMTDGVTAGTFIDLDTASTGGSSSISDSPVYGAMGVNIITATTPVVLDLSRDGVLSYTQVVLDVNGDGHLDQTAWAAAQDGVLVLDKYADGKVHDNSQYAFSQYGAAGSTDLQGLAAGFDSNHDGVLDAKDAKFAQFKVWQDANQNGVSDAGEVRSLGDLGIASIGLTSDNVVRTPAAGVTEVGQSSAVLADGSSMLVADAMFDYTSLDYTLAGTASGDRLHLLGGNTTLDLSSIVAAHHNLTAIDLTGTAVNGATGANTVKLSLADVLGVAADASIANGVHKLTLTGDANDMVELDLSQWANTGATVTEGDHTYAVYNASSTTAAQLLIDQHMLVAQHA
ncbi:Ig-like domain-containing protein [Limnohabitans sp.]|uniref:beta strand repeat-containing protein n=1 Tax=Limnohabitans sp. TaxID=1907725 RepID=UPI00286F8251|nr:Ig-like domain-containing protein [Limnohabitans sp.]